jgi:hypothetical protein
MTPEQVKEHLNQTAEALSKKMGISKVTALKLMIKTTREMLNNQNSNKESKEQPTYPGWPPGWTKEEIEAEDREIAQALKAMSEKMARGDFSD